MTSPIKGVRVGVVRQPACFGAVRGAGLLSVQRFARLRREAAQKRRDMTRDRGIGRVGQAKFDDRATRPAGPFVRRHRRKETVDDDPLDLVARDLHRARAADQFRARAEQRDRGGVGRLRAEQLFLRMTATLDQLRQTRSRQTRALFRRIRARQPRLHPMRERQIHVVAAEHQMIADADPRELRLAIVQADFDQREVGGAAAHVADEHETGVREFVGEPLAMMKQPVVERRLRLFEQLEAIQTGHARGLHGERARAFVEGSRHREHHVLMFERRVRKTMVPGRAHMREIARAGFDRRDFTDLVGGAPRQDRRNPVDRRMREPALRARDEPAWHLSAQQAREPADHDRLRGVLGFWMGCLLRCLPGSYVRICLRCLPGIYLLRCRRTDLSIGSRAAPIRTGPRQLQIAGTQLALRRVIAHRRQQRPRGDFAGAHQLLDLEDANGLRPRLRIGEHRVAGAEIDADAVPLHLIHAFALPRTSNSTFQRSSVPRGTASSSSVPASVTRACSFTGTTSPAVRPDAGRVA